MSRQAIRPTDAQMKAYAQAFDFFNEKLFDGRLPQPMLGFTTKKTVNGIFISNAWRDHKAGDYIHEIRFDLSS